MDRMGETNYFLLYFHLENGSGEDDSRSLGNSVVRMGCGRRWLRIGFSGVEL
jgi:hypothetical protein